MGSMARDPPDHEQEESLSSGLERQMEAFNNVHQQMGNFASDLARLKTQCDALKKERMALLQDVALRESDRTSLDGEIERLKAQRDSLQIEFAALCEDEQFLRQADAQAATEMEVSGRMARQLWLAGEKITQLEQQIGDVDNVHASEMEAERQVAAGLRLRIQRLERKLREPSADAAKVSSGIEAEHRMAMVEAEHQNAVLQDEIARLRVENLDARDAMTHEENKCSVAVKRADVLAEKLQTAGEEVVHYRAEGASLAEDNARLGEELHRSRETVDALQVENNTLSKQLAATMATSTPPVLQRLSSNISTSAPHTPTKPHSQPTFDTPKHSKLSPNANHSKQYAHLERQHIALKAAFDKLRSKYQTDLKHWQAYRAIQDERRAIRHRRRSERQSAAAPLEEKSSAVGSVAPDSMPKEEPDRTPSPTVAEVKLEASPEPVAANDSPPHPPTVKRHFSDNEWPRPPPKRSKPSLQGEPRPTSLAGAPTAVSDDVRTDSRTAQRTTSTTPSGRQLSASVTPSRSFARQPTRVTPWLGGKKSSSKKVVEQGSFGSDSEGETSAAARVRTPLVRDRTGDTSLRRSALMRVVAGDVEDTVTPKTEPVTPGSSSKRLLDFGNLTPAERAAERKRISRLSTSERNELYAPYKGKGRYVMPEDVKRGVRDEYEVDPVKNNGVSHQYHDVVRNKDERRKMHGGDCECCRDFYEAVGDIPLYNQGPAWGDTTSPERKSVNLEDHQNRVSRHRETWRKPPTPPDYWRIGFPDTQDVEDMNARADMMVAQREAEIRREVAHKDSKWRKRK